MKHYDTFLQSLNDSLLANWAEHLPGQIAQGLDTNRYGDLPKWQAVIKALPDYKPSSIDLTSATVRIGEPADITDEQRDALKQELQKLHPWRKGPFEIFGIHIDTEWRSDWKWDRLKKHITPLQGRQVLDVGCGNGYHCWRMLGEGASDVLGIDPLPLFSMQYRVMQHYINSDKLIVLPLGIDDVPAKLQAFDTVFSMGVLYHRRSPLDHILQLKDCLVDGGELVLETLVIDGDSNDVLVPEGRYARMGNVWFIPSADMLVRWCERCGLKNIRVVDINQTSTEEQRATEWMTFQSLADFLDPHEPNKSIEGYPAPKRAIVIAEK